MRFVNPASAIFRSTLVCHCRSRSLVEAGNEIIVGGALSHAGAHRYGLPASTENAGNARIVADQSPGVGKHME